MFNFFKGKTAEVFYARHITHGISSYSKKDEKDPAKKIFYNTLITKEVLDDMNDTFSGKPVVITHKDWEKQTPVGYVVKSFYLPQDGYFWAEFIIDDPRALNFIKNQNFRVSNGYKATAVGQGGRYHDIEYEEEVLKGEYLHLALTSEPKFAEAIILDRKQFKEFRNKLEKIDNKFNEKEDKMLFFKKTKVDNSEEILNTSFELGGKEFTVKSMIDTLTEKLNEGEKKYSTCNGEFTAEELVGKYNAACDELKKNEEEKAKAEAEKKAEEEKKAEAEKKAEEEAKKKEEEEKKNEALKKEEEQKKLNERLVKIEAEKNKEAVEFKLNSNGTLDKIEK